MPLLEIAELTNRDIAAMRSISSDEIVRRAIVAELWFRFGFQLGDDPLCEHFAQFDTPLIEAIDVPDHPLHEHGVLIERDQLAEHGRRQPLGQNRVRRPIAGEHAMRH